MMNMMPLLDDAKGGNFSLLIKVERVSGAYVLIDVLMV